MSRKRPIARFFDTVLIGASKNKFLEDVLYSSAGMQILPLAFDGYGMIQPDSVEWSLMKVSLSMNAVLAVSTTLAMFIAYGIGKRDEDRGGWTPNSGPPKPTGSQPTGGGKSPQDLNKLFQICPLPVKAEKVLEEVQ